MTFTRRYLLLLVLVVSIVEPIAVSWAAQADSPERIKSLQDTIRHEKEHLAKRRLAAQRNAAEAYRMAQEQARMYQMQLYAQFAVQESSRTGIQARCSRCGQLVSPYSAAGQICPYCGAYWSANSQFTAQPAFAPANAGGYLQPFGGLGGPGFPGGMGSAFGGPGFPGGMGGAFGGPGFPGGMGGAFGGPGFSGGTGGAFGGIGHPGGMGGGHVGGGHPGGMGGGHVGGGHVGGHG
jgi:hypothetical protein